MSRLHLAVVLGAIVALIGCSRLESRYTCMFWLVGACTADLASSTTCSLAESKAVVAPLASPERSVTRP